MIECRRWWCSVPQPNAQEQRDNQSCMCRERQHQRTSSTQCLCSKQNEPVAEPLGFTREIRARSEPQPRGATGRVNAAGRLRRSRVTDSDGPRDSSGRGHGEACVARKGGDAASAKAPAGPPGRFGWASTRPCGKRGGPGRMGRQVCHLVGPTSLPE
jgi:hypothetical protein